MEEEWRSVPQASYYKVSTLGRVVRVKGSPKCTYRDRPLKPFRRGNYYYVSLLHNDGLYKSVGIHNLVLETFGPPKPDGHEADHKDRKTENNRLDNLRWLSIEVNRGQRGEKNPGAKLKEGEVWLIKRLIGGDRFRKYLISRDLICAMFNTHKSTVQRIKYGGRWKCLEN